MMKFVIAALLLTSLGFAQEPPPSENIPELETIETESVTEVPQYIYDPVGKKDPFRPFRAPRLRGDNEPSAPVDPLLLLDVSKIELVAIMWNTTRPRAVIRADQTKFFTIFKNTRVGRNEGVVADIREGQVIIVEKFDDGLGNIIRESRVLEMKVDTGNQTQTAGG